jgi:hypothetical protein
MCGGTVDALKRNLRRLGTMVSAVAKGIEVPEFDPATVIVF